MDELSRLRGSEGYGVSSDEKKEKGSFPAGLPRPAVKKLSGSCQSIAAIPACPLKGQAKKEPPGGRSFLLANQANSTAKRCRIAATCARVA